MLLFSLPSYVVVKPFEQFQQHTLIAISCAHTQERITNARILEQADTTNIGALKKGTRCHNWETRAADRAHWLHTSRMCASHLERRRIIMEAEKRDLQNNREHDNDTETSACMVCGRICRQSNGLYSHLRTH